jgi:hypothetical protein
MSQSPRAKAPSHDEYDDDDDDNDDDDDDDLLSLDGQPFTSPRRSVSVG